MVLFSDDLKLGKCKLAGTKAMLLEVCCTDMDSVLAAQEGGADRVELCSDIEADGLTPSSELIRLAVGTGLRVHVLIRPRDGNFVYSEAEAEQMLRDIEMARECGAHGVVVGALTAEGDVDLPLCHRMIAAAKGMGLTFHRAFDVCRDYRVAFQQIMEMGFHRLLTSGQAEKAHEGLSVIAELVAASHAWHKVHPQQPRLIVMPGSGVNARNAATILSETGATEIHGTLRECVDGRLHTTSREVRRTKENIEWRVNNSSFAQLDQELRS